MSVKVRSPKKTDPFSVFKRTLNNGLISYYAGLPKYPRNFSRDTIIAGIIASSSELLISQLEVSAEYQGKHHDPQTGESPGRIHHELPGISIHGRHSRYTTYNACDTTPLFLIAIDILKHLDAKLADDFIQRKRPNIESALKYIHGCLDENNMFMEGTPKDADGYALKVTYWKDSILPNVNGRSEPAYPVVYPLAHFIAARSLLGASRILNDKSLKSLSDKMYRAGIKQFIRPDGYIVYRDSIGELIQTSSDELHSLAYIPSEFKDLLPLEAIRNRAKILATPLGFMCTPEQIAKQLNDRYHGDTIWAFEQAMIHYGASKFGLQNEMRTADSIAELIADGQELFGFKLDAQGRMLPMPIGNSHQLWSVAASQYFEGRSSLLAKSWL